MASRATCEAQWFNIVEEVHAYALALWHGDGFDTIEEFLEMIANADRHTDGRNDWVAAGRPEEW